MISRGGSGEGTMTNVRALSMVCLVVLAGCTPSSVTDGGVSPPDAGPDVDGGRDAGPDAPASDDGGPACGGRCPPEQCVDGSCRPSGDCCDTGVCPDGFLCDFFGSCGCVEATGCCAGEACEGGASCDFFSCTCVREDDCCVFGCREPWMTCEPGTCGCVEDTSCGASCTGDFLCTFGSCMHRCVFDGCPEGLTCSDSEGCVEPRCTRTECALHDPMRACDPGRGCYDPCERAEEWDWCTSMGGVCFYGNCVDPTCRGGAIGCHYRTDCCGRRLCIEDSELDPPCDPDACRSVDPPPREELCACGMFSLSCEDLWDGFIVGPPRPEPFDDRHPR